MADKQQPQGISARRATEEDDVEGHSFIHARDSVATPRATEPEGLSQRKATEDEDDVEGHSMLLNPLAARELAKAREREVQQNVRRHQFENDARVAKKDQR
jgi:hypothetical protein